MKKLLLIPATLVLVLSVAIPVQAVGVKNEVKAEVKAAIDARKDLRAELKEKIASFSSTIQALRNGRIAIGSGELTAINGTTLTITKDGKVYTVHTDSTTIFRRKFWGKSEVGEMSVGDKINVVGMWEDTAKMTIKARFVRDISIQKRHGVFFGNVTVTSSTGFTINSQQRGTQTVTLSTVTKIVNRKEETLSKNDVTVGHRVRVRGLWDSVNKTITEVIKVKDFTLPLQPKATAKPAASAE